MNRAFQLDDATLRQALLGASEIELGFEQAAHDHVMRAVRATPQRRSWIAGVISIRPRALALLAALTVLVAVGGALVIGSLLRPPAPKPLPMQIYHHNGIILTLNSQLFDVTEPDGSPRRAPLQVPPVRPGMPSWSPDGNQLVVSGVDGVQVGDIATGSVRTIWSCNGACRAAEWAPDGQTIAIAAGDRVILVSPAGTLAGGFSLPRHLISALSWAPDSQRLAVAVDWPEPTSPNEGDPPVSHGTSGLFIVDRTGAVISELKAVSGDGAGIEDVAWSPDGQSIAYIAAKWRHRCCAFDYSLVTIRPDGGNKQVLAPAGACYCMGVAPPGVAWAPDGTLIAFGDAGTGLAVIQPDGSGRRWIGRNYYAPAWRPVP
jgi:dipeptidyl aminopeptidase/acylaminoacyl peptidase